MNKLIRAKFKNEINKNENKLESRINRLRIIMCKLILNIFRKLTLRLQHVLEFRSEWVHKIQWEEGTGLRVKCTEILSEGMDRKKYDSLRIAAVYSTSRTIPDGQR